MSKWVTSLFSVPAYVTNSILQHSEHMPTVQIILVLPRSHLLMAWVQLNVSQATSLWQSQSTSAKCSPSMSLLLSPHSLLFIYRSLSFCLYVANGHVWGQAVHIHLYMTLALASNEGVKENASVWKKLEKYKLYVISSIRPEKNEILQSKKEKKESY